MEKCYREITANIILCTTCRKILQMAYSVVKQVHLYSKIAKHGGIEPLLRCTLSTAYMIEGREVVKKVKKDCYSCRLLPKRTVMVSMGAVSHYKLMIPPAFYYTQLDLSGPFKAYTLHNKNINS